MKKLTLILSLSGIFLQSCITINADGEGKKGNYTYEAKYQNSEDFSKNPMESHTFFVSPFQKIEAQSSMKFFIKKSDKQRVEVNSNASQYVVVSCKNGKLEVKYDNYNTALQNVKTEVTVYTDSFDKLTVQSAGKINISDDFQLKNLQLDLSSAGDIDGNINAQNLKVNASSASNLSAKINVGSVTIDASSASKINLSGKAETAKIDASSVAIVNLENLECDNIQKSSSSQAKILTK